MFKFRKIASVLTSAVMLSSTVALAAAANFPAPFVKNGMADVAIVYGSSASVAATDLVAVADIQRHLSEQLAMQTATSGSSGSTASAGGEDIVSLSKPSDKLNLRDVVTTVFGSTLTEDDLPKLLADGTYTNDENSDFDYEQRVALGSGLVFNFFSDSDYNDREPTLGINLTSNQLVLNYSLDFTTDAESDVSGGDLVDIETTNLKVLGREYYISDFDNSTLDITLLDTANSAIVSEGETQSVTVGSNSYDVSINFVTTNSVRLNVNGEVTNSLSEGGTFKLSDGTYVGIKDILVQDYAGGIKKVEFSLGNGKLELRNGQSAKLNDKSIQELTTEVKRGTASGGKEKIDRINLVWTTQDDTFITLDSELVLPGLESIKFSIPAIVRNADEVTKVTDGSTSYIQLQTTLKDGAVTIPLLYANASGEFEGIGKDSSDLLVTSNLTGAFAVSYNHTAGARQMVASWASTTEAESYLIRFTNFVNDNGINKTTIQSYRNGGWEDRCADRRGGDTCTLGSLTLTLGSVSPYPDRTVNVTGNSGASFNTLYTKEGLRVHLPYGTATTNTSVAAQQTPGRISLNGTDAEMYAAGHSTGSFYLVFQEEDKNGNIGSGSQFNVTIDDNSDGEVEASAITTGRTAITDPDDSNRVISYLYSDLATMVERTGASSDQREVTISYAGEEVYADLVLTAGSATVSSEGGSSGGSVTSLGSVLYKDSEVSSVSSKNLIVVGGSCINSVAAELLGGAACGADFTTKTGVAANQFLIQTFSRTGGKVATLVAGYNAGDTTNAARYLTTQTVDTTVDKKYVGASATSAELVVA